MAADVDEGESSLKSSALARLNKRWEDFAHARFLRIWGVVSGSNLVSVFLRRCPREKNVIVTGGENVIPIEVLQCFTLKLAIRRCLWHWLTGYRKVHFVFSSSLTFIMFNFMRLANATQKRADPRIYV